MRTCPICSSSHHGNSKRYGVYCCPGCASFFRKTVYLKREYVCSENNDCFKRSLSKGVNCCKCRYKKCLEVGMLSPKFFADDILQKTSDAQKTTETLISPPNTTAAIPQPTVTSEEQNKIWAERLECVLETLTDYPKLIESYFSGRTIDLLKLPSEIQFSTATTDAIYYFTLLLEKYPIKNSDELRLLCVICICKFEFKWLSESEQLKIKETQKQGFENIKNSIVETNRFNELIVLSSHALNIFHALL